MTPHLTRGWFLKGSKPVIKTSYGPGRISVFGALSENEFSAQMTEKKCNWETYLQFLKSLLRKYGKVLLVVDGARYHFEKAHVQKFYKEKKGVLKIVQLPAYSPELNPIEQTWKKIKNQLAICPWATKEDFDAVISEALGRREFMTKMYGYYLL